MKFFWTILDVVNVIIDNMFNKRWWYVWAFQAIFIMILSERVFLEPKNAPLYLIMLSWTTFIVILLNVEASYSDHVRKSLKKYINMIGFKATMGDTSAD